MPETPFQPDSRQQADFIQQADSDSAQQAAAEEQASSPKTVRRFNLLDRLLGFRSLLLLFALSMTVIAIPIADRLTLDESIESLFAPDSPLLLDYLESKKLFGGDEFILVAWKQDDLLESETLGQIKSFVEELNRVPGIRPESTQSLTGVLRPKGMGALGGLFMRIPSVREQALTFSQGMLINKDRDTTAIVLRLESQENSAVSQSETFAAVREIAASHSPPAYVVGELVQVHDMYRIVEKDGAVLGWASSGVLLLIILFLFRSFRWMFLPLLVVHVALVWTKAFLVLSGLQLSMVSSMLNSLVTIIGIATVMHITVYFRELRTEYDRRSALLKTMRDLLPPIAWTCGTTAVGFAALFSSSIVPIQSFGLMMTIGTGMVFLAVLAIIPAGVLIGRIDTDPRESGWEKRVTQGLLQLVNLVFRFPRFVGIVALGLALFGLSGLAFLRVETDFSQNFRDRSPIVASLNFVESNLGGAGNYEVDFTIDVEQTEENYQKLRLLAEELRELKIDGQFAVTKVIALTDGLDLIPRIMGRTDEAKRKTLAKMQPEFEPSLFNAEQQRMRIILRALERQPAELKLQLIEEVTTVAQKYFPDAQSTGLYVLLANIILSLLEDQLVSFGIASVGIFLMMSLAFRDWKIGLISMVPNLFPIILLIGTLGWIGSLVNIGTAMIASVSLGLTVDSSIHYLSVYMKSRKNGMGHDDSLRLTQSRVGLALVFANIALVCGFSVLTLSEFVPLVYFGVLVSIAMLGGLLGNLVLLPLLLTTLHRYESNKSH
ncbi:MAG: MMPL family transporter [Planctomycetaceae bacterium]|nr:MMPL family transporter [Planctomycetaceae bacterium]